MNDSGDHSHEDLFAAAAALRGAERAAFLDQHCAGDEAMRAELESLLQANDEAEDFLEISALAAHGFAGVEDDEAAPLPEHIGSYAILGLLGEGGMGTVYLARQDGTSREVALKVMRHRYASAATRRRFQQEARTLGMLHHPGIAQVYEAGLADAGGGPQPFFAMELVDGRPLTTHAREGGLDVPRRLELIAQVCDAVDHAHGRGVIHRDLKPANVLVDAQGRPRVLDFGIARATSPDSTMTMHTRPGQLIGTLAYMAPEQVAGDPAAVDGRCDVYALGVMLYELLSGNVPFASDATPLPEMLRRIREQEVPALGTRSGELRGDIETIVGKAIEKDPARRYATAAALAEDIRRHLRNEPILAKSPGLVLQGRKFVRRNRALVGATAAVFAALVLLVAGVSAALVRALEAEQIAVAQQRTAEKEAQRAEAVSQFLQEMLAGVDPSIARAADTTLLRRILDVASQRVDRLGDTPEVEATVRLVIGGSYLFAGLYAEAEEHIERGWALRREVLGESHGETLEAANRAAVLYHGQGRYAEAEALYRQVLDARRKLGPGHERWVLESVSNLAALYLDLNRGEDAEPLCIEAVEGRRRLLGDEHDETLQSMGNLAGLYFQQRRDGDAEPLWRQVMEVRQRTVGNEHPATLIAMSNMALLYSRTGKVEESASLFREVVERRRVVMGAEHPETLRSAMHYAQALVTLGRFAEAEAAFAEVLEVQSRVLGDAHLHTLALLNNLASLHLSQGRAVAAESLLTRVVDSARASLPAGNIELPLYMASRGIAKAAQARYSDAEGDLLEAHGLLASAGDSGAVGRERLVWVVQMLVRLYEEWGRPDDAAAWRAQLPITPAR